MRAADTLSHTHTHTHTHDNYHNPLCICAPRVNNMQSCQLYIVQKAVLEPMKQCKSEKTGCKQ